PPRLRRTRSLAHASHDLCLIPAASSPRRSPSHWLSPRHIWPRALADVIDPPPTALNRIGNEGDLVRLLDQAARICALGQVDGYAVVAVGYEDCNVVVHKIG